MERAWRIAGSLPRLVRVLGGSIALLSLVMPWLSDQGMNTNLPSLISTFSTTFFGYRPPLFEKLLVVTILVAVLVVLGGIMSLAHPLGGVGSVAGAVLFFVAMPLIPATGPYVALVGGLVSLFGFGLGRTRGTTGRPRPPAGVTCGQCFSENPPGSVFCNRCGAPLTQSRTPSTAALDTLK